MYAWSSFSVLVIYRAGLPRIARVNALIGPEAPNQVICIVVRLNIFEFSLVFSFAKRKWQFSTNIMISQSNSSR